MQYFDLSVHPNDGFRLTAAPDFGGATAQDRVYAAHMRTLLYHWGHELLPEWSGLSIIHRAAPLEGGSNLLALDRTGRGHHFRVVRDGRVDSEDTHPLDWLVGYLVQGTADRRDLAHRYVHALHHGQQREGMLLAALMAGADVEHEPVADDLRLAERLAARTESALARVAQRPEHVTAARLAEWSQPALQRHLGRPGATEVAHPALEWGRFAQSHLARTFAADGPPVGWLVQPSAPSAEQLHRLQRLRSRGVDLRWVTMDARVVEAGRRWRIGVQVPGRLQGDRAAWRHADHLRSLGHRIADSHAAQVAGARAQLKVWATHDELRVGWRGLAGPMDLVCTAQPDGPVAWRVYSDWWTEGQARSLRDIVNGSTQALQRIHPAQLPTWGEPGDQADAFVTEATEVLNGLWRYLESEGVPLTDEWASLRAAPPTGTEAGQP